MMAIFAVILFVPEIVCKDDEEEQTQPESPSEETS
jgi:hypothetical protein